MAKVSALLILVCFLAACSGNPFDPDEPPTEETGEPDAPPVSGGGVPPGTGNPTPDTTIVRVEPRDEAGNGYANNFTYDQATDTFFVQGLGFDGDQPTGVPYERVANVVLPTGFAAYEGPTTVPDFLTGAPIDQLEHRAVYGASASGRSQLAIVRTGSYTNYGFGGFIYQRSGGVTLPTLPSQGQATYRGEYAGLRDYNDKAGLDYVTGKAQIDIDFDGFSGNCTPARCADAVRGRITDRRVLGASDNDVAGTDGSTALPVIQFRIGTGVLNSNGEITGDAFSNDQVTGEELEAGKYYAIMGGNHTSLDGGGGEIVGIIVVEGDFEGVTARETGGFIVNRALQ